MVAMTAIARIASAAHWRIAMAGNPFTPARTSHEIATAAKPEMSKVSPVRSSGDQVPFVA
jgi:hypothetical protein